MSGALETRLGKAITLLKNHRIEEIEQVLSALTAVLGEDSTPLDDAFLSWKEAREMAGSGLMSFGSHTAGHRILTTLAEEQAEHELVQPGPSRLVTAQELTREFRIPKVMFRK